MKDLKLYLTSEQKTKAKMMKNLSLRKMKKMEKVKVIFLMLIYN